MKKNNDNKNKQDNYDGFSPAVYLKNHFMPFVEPDDKADVEKFQIKKDLI